MLTFDQSIFKDFESMLNTNEFAVQCINARTGQAFSAIWTDRSIEIDDQGMPIIQDQPMFNTSASNDIAQLDVLTIGIKKFTVYRTMPDGIGGIDVYLRGESA